MVTPEEIERWRTPVPSEDEFRKLSLEALQAMRQDLESKVRSVVAAAQANTPFVISTTPE